MPMPFSAQEIVETIRMVQMENLDIRTITLGISLRGCAHPHFETMASNVYDTVCRRAEKLIAAGDAIQREYGIPIINKRISVTPIALVAESSAPDGYIAVAHALDRAAAEVGVNFIGGFSALVHKGMTGGDRALIAAIPEALTSTERVCASVNIGTTRPAITATRNRTRSSATCRPSCGGSVHTSSTDRCSARSAHPSSTSRTTKK